MNNDLISREALLKAMEEERQYLLARGQTGAEHIIVHHCLPIIDNAPTVEPDMDFAKECYANGYEDGKNERPQGEWLIEGGTTFHFSCSQCGCAGDEWDKFCRHCGAKMRKGGASW